MIEFGRKPEATHKAQVEPGVMAGATPSVAPVQRIDADLSASTPLRSERLTSSGSSASPPEMVALSAAILLRAHNDFGSLSQTLRARCDLVMAVVSGDPKWLSRGWDEVYIQDSSHHEGTCEMIRARGRYGESGSSFTVLGVPVEVFTRCRDSFAQLREAFPPPQEPTTDLEQVEPLHSNPDR